MNYLILNGMNEEDLFIPKVEKIVSDRLKKQKCTGEAIQLHEKEIKPCLGCFKCWIQTPGICIIDDYGREIAKRMIQSNNLIYITPIFFGGYSSELKKALDRSICLILPFFRKYNSEIHHERRYENYPNLIVFGILEEKDTEQEEIFTTLVERNVLNNCNPNHSSEVIYHSDNENIIKKKIENCLRIIGDKND